MTKYEQNENYVTLISHYPFIKLKYRSEFWTIQRGQVYLQEIHHPCVSLTFAIFTVVRVPLSGKHFVRGALGRSASLYLNVYIYIFFIGSLRITIYLFKWVSWWNFYIWNWIVFLVSNIVSECYHLYGPCIGVGLGIYPTSGRSCRPGVIDIATE